MSSLMHTCFILQYVHYSFLHVLLTVYLTISLDNVQLVMHTCFILQYVHYSFLHVLLTVHLSISLDNDQLDAHLLYFTIRRLQSCTYFEHYMLIMRRLNCIDAASGIVRPVSGRPVHRTFTDWANDTRCYINTVQPPHDEHIMLETRRGL